MNVKTRTTFQSDWTDPTPERPRREPAWQLRLIRFGFQTLGRLFPGLAAKFAFRLFATPTVRAKHRTSDEILESARIFDVLYGKRILKGYAWGPREGAPTVLLVHGWNSRGTALRTFVPDLLERGYRVVAMDGPAHGHSDGKRTHLIDFAGGVRAMLNHLDDVHGIITHSFGGASTVYALGHLLPERAIEKLVLIGVPAKMTRVFEHSVRVLALPPNVARRFVEIPQRILGVSFEEFDTAAYKDRMNVNDILVIHDRTDAVVNFKSAEENYRELSRASLLVTEGYGHYRMMKNPDLIHAVVEFVDRRVLVVN